MIKCAKCVSHEDVIQYTTEIGNGFIFNDTDYICMAINALSRFITHQHAEINNDRVYVPISVAHINRSL